MKCTAICRTSQEKCTSSSRTLIRGFSKEAVDEISVVISITCKVQQIHPRPYIKPRSKELRIFARHSGSDSQLLTTLYRTVLSRERIQEIQNSWSLDCERPLCHQSWTRTPRF